MRPNVGNWTYIEDGLPELYTPVYVACRAKDGSRKNWVAECMLYGYNREPIKNPWNLPILDLDDYEAYAWMPYWRPNAPKERQG